MGEVTERSEVRPLVAKTAESMEQMLRKNDHKGGWEKCTMEWLDRKLTEELAELDRAIYELRNHTGCSGYIPAEKTEELKRQVREEAADVHNILAMIVDNLGCL